jgi:hypothetical protein
MAIKPPDFKYGGSNLLSAMIAQALANQYRETPTQTYGRQLMMQRDEQGFRAGQAGLAARRAEEAEARDAVLRYQYNVMSGLITPASELQTNPAFRDRQIQTHEFNVGDLYGARAVQNLPVSQQTFRYGDPHQVAAAREQDDYGLMARIDQQGPYADWTAITDPGQRAFLRDNPHLIPEALAPTPDDVEQVLEQARALSSESPLFADLVRDIEADQATFADEERLPPLSWLQSMDERIQDLISRENLLLDRRRVATAEMGAQAAASQAASSAGRLEQDIAENQATYEAVWRGPLIRTSKQGQALLDYMSITTDDLAKPADLTVAERDALGQINFLMAQQGLSETDAISTVAGEDPALTERYTELHNEWVPMPGTLEPQSAIAARRMGSGNYTAPASLRDLAAGMYGPESFSDTTHDPNWRTSIGDDFVPRLQRNPDIWNRIRELNIEMDGIGDVASTDLTTGVIERLFRDDPAFARAAGYTLQHFGEDAALGRPYLNQLANAAASDEKYVSHMPDDRTLMYIQWLSKLGGDAEYANRWGGGDSAEADTYFENYRNIARDWEAGEYLTPPQIAMRLGIEGIETDEQGNPIPVPVEAAGNIPAYQNDALLGEYTQSAAFRMLDPNQIPLNWEDQHYGGYRIGRVLHALENYDDKHGTGQHEKLMEHIRKMTRVLDQRPQSIIRDLERLANMLPETYLQADGASRSRSKEVDWIRDRVNYYAAWLKGGGAVDSFMNTLLEKLAIGWTMIDDGHPDPLRAEGQFNRSIIVPIDRSQSGFGPMAEQWWDRQLSRRGITPEE